MKYVVITGAGRGIGASLAAEFLKQEFYVIATARAPETSEALKVLRREHPERCRVEKLDVTDPVSIKDFDLRLQGSMAVDVLINNAGIIGDTRKNFSEISAKDLTSVFETNCIGPALVTSALMPRLTKATAPKVINMTSQMGSIADNQSGGNYAYRISKAALNMLTKTLAVDFPKITFAALHPGWVKTDMGGASAPVTPSESVQYLVEIINSLKPSDTGAFRNYKGEELPW